jgi:hypothetical protein
MATTTNTTTKITTTTTANASPECSLSTDRSNQDITHELFQCIVELVCDFVQKQPNHQYPCYRVMRWTTSEQSNVEEFVTVIVNQSTRIL